MPPRNSRFRLDEEISFSGKPMRVVGLVQYEDADAALVTRYLLGPAAGAPVILEDGPAGLAVLRPFPGNAQPQASGSTVMVMSEKYALSGVHKRKILGSAGQPPGGPPKGELLLSGVFPGDAGELVREMTPGTAMQTFFSLKRISPGEVLSGDQLSARLEAERHHAGERAQLDDEDEPAADQAERIQKAVALAVVVLVIIGLAVSCSASA